MCFLQNEAKCSDNLVSKTFLGQFKFDNCDYPFRFIPVLHTVCFVLQHGSL
jgi:hypothetical protein